MKTTEAEFKKPIIYDVRAVAVTIDEEVSLMGLDNKIEFNPEFLLYVSKLWQAPVEMCEDFLIMFHDEYVEVRYHKGVDGVTRPILWVGVTYKCALGKSELIIEDTEYEMPLELEWYWKERVDAAE